MVGSLVNAMLLARMNVSKQRRRSEILAPYAGEELHDAEARA